MNLKDIKGVIFDYGGTIDTNGDHWAEVLWDAYLKNRVPVSKEQFREGYVFAERALAKYPYIRPTHNFYDVLFIKADLELSYMESEQMLPFDEARHRAYVQQIADDCYRHVLDVLQTTREVVRQIAQQKRVVLVSNFYGNIQTILEDFGLDAYFLSVVESSVVGVRKPDPAIFRLGVEALGLQPGEVLVVGDSYRKDMMPAHAIGCRTAWIKGREWESEDNDASKVNFVITDLKQLLNL